jgi:hypothetical protein
MCASQSPCDKVASSSEIASRIESTAAQAVELIRNQGETVATCRG